MMYSDCIWVKYHISTCHSGWCYIAVRPAIAWDDGSMGAILISLSLCGLGQGGLSAVMYPFIGMD